MAALSFPIETTNTNVAILVRYSSFNFPATSSSDEVDHSHLKRVSCSRCPTRDKSHLIATHRFSSMLPSTPPKAVDFHWACRNCIRIEINRVKDEPQVPQEDGTSPTIYFNCLTCIETLAASMDKIRLATASPPPQVNHSDLRHTTSITAGAGAPHSETNRSSAYRAFLRGAPVCLDTEI